MAGLNLPRPGAGVRAGMFLLPQGAGGTDHLVRKFQPVLDGVAVLLHMPPREGRVGRRDAALGTFVHTIIFGIPGGPAAGRRQAVGNTEGWRTAAFGYRQRTGRPTHGSPAFPAVRAE